MTERITDPERYGMAAGNGQLTHRLERMAPADTVAAAGMAGRVEPLGLALWRVKYAGDRTAYRHAQSLLCARVANVSRKRKWGETPKALRLLAHQVFAWSVFGVCPVCTGRGHPSFGEGDGRQVLSDDLCPVCHGDGTTPIERVVPVQLIGRAKDIAQLLFEADREMGAGIRLHLRGRIAR